MTCFFQRTHLVAFLNKKRRYYSYTKGFFKSSEVLDIAKEQNEDSKCNKGRVCRLRDKNIV